MRGESHWSIVLVLVQEKVPVRGLVGQGAEIRADGSCNVSVTHQSGCWCPQTGSRPAVSPWSPAPHRLGGRPFVPVGAGQQRWPLSSSSVKGISGCCDGYTLTPVSPPGIRASLQTEASSQKAQSADGEHKRHLLPPPFSAKTKFKTLQDPAQPQPRVKRIGNALEQQQKKRIRRSLRRKGEERSSRSQSEKINTHLHEHTQLDQNPTLHLHHWS